jgi:hypothetical protein
MAACAIISGAHVADHDTAQVRYSAAMSTMTVRKCLPDGTPVFSYQASLAERLPCGVKLTAYWERDSLELGYTTFETGDHFTEWYYSDRWFNILRIRRASDGALKGWYCNITTPAEIAATEVVYRDLYLDVWVAPDGSVLILDEDEFDAAPLDEELRAHAREGLRQLLGDIESGERQFEEVARP